MKSQRVANKSQSALEFMTVVGIGLILLTITSVIGIDYISNYFTDINIINGKQTVSNIVSASSLVYSQGIGAKSRISVTIPQNILRNFTYISGKEVNIRLDQGGLKDIFQNTGTNISGAFPLGEGKQYLYVQMVPSQTPGSYQGEVRVYLDDPNYAYIGVQTFKYNGSAYVLSNNFTTSDTIYYNITVFDITDSYKMPPVDVAVYNADNALMESDAFTVNYTVQPYDISTLSTGTYIISVRITEMNAVGTKLFNVS